MMQSSWCIQPIASQHRISHSINSGSLHIKLSHINQQRPLYFITDLKTFQEVFARFKEIDGWMIGRGAVTIPFLPAIIKAGRDDISHKVEKFKQYRQVFCGPGHLLNRMKGFWTYFSKAFQDSRNIAKKVHRTQKLHRCIKIVDRFFVEEAQWRE